MRGMKLVILLLISLLVFRAAGALGVVALASWIVATRCALALMFVVTGIAHFNNTRHDLARMVPRVFPAPMAIIYITGVLEILGAIGLLLTRFHSLAGLCLIVLLVAMFPANIKAAEDKLALLGKPATPLWLRIPMQALFIGLLWWSTQPWTFPRF